MSELPLVTLRVSCSSCQRRCMRCGYTCLSHWCQKRVEAGTSTCNRAAVFLLTLAGNENNQIRANVAGSSTNNRQTCRGCPANMAHIRQSRPHCGRGFQAKVLKPFPTLETTQGRIDGLFGQLPFKCYLPEVASVGD